MKKNPISIMIDLSDHNAHLFNVSMHIPYAVVRQRLSLPVWTPGSYMVREFAQHIVSFEALDSDEKINYKKINKNTFELDNESSNIIVKYQVYAFDSSIRAAYIDNQQAFFNGTALFLCPEGLEDSEYSVSIPPPRQETWNVATTMPALKVDARGFGTYHSQNYEELIDFPFQVSAMKRLPFMTADIPHEIVLVGDVRPFDEQRLVRDLSKLCAEHHALFKQSPFDKYLFIARFEEGGYGGLEHRNSSMLLSSSNALPQYGLKEPDAQYRNFLGLCSHEYFHAWNVKAIKPKSFVPYNLNEECYTESLWIFEGITSYYDELLVRRAGLISQQSYLELMSKNLTRLERNRGRFTQSLYDASFDAWIKFYRPNENSTNATTSYYLKGSIVALYLDLFIRFKNSNKKTLDDVMRSVFIAYGDGHGMFEEQFLDMLKEIGDLDINEFKERFLSGTEDAPLEKLLNHNGVSLAMEADEIFVDDKTRMNAHLGCKIRFDDNQRALITFVELEGPAMKAGLAPFDEIVAINSIRIDAKNWPELASALKPDEEVEIVYARKKRLFQLKLWPSNVPTHQCKLSIQDGEENIIKRQSWLGEETVFI
ncbi:MAG: M61 family metallopeptidase [Myxococcales bacterium]|nr:M61 family metallopeptidase [Myxococcales bacterium]USN50666.1 MAG: M61 family metallopeptidase [Myxococcales bacterium]